MNRICILLSAALLFGCAGTQDKVQDPEKANDALISFITKAQAGFWNDAMENITYEERAQMMDGEQVKPEYQAAIKRLRLGSVGNMEFSLDSKGRLIGVQAMLDASNRRSKVSEAQSNIDLSAVENARAARIDKMRQEGKQILEDQQNQRQEPEVEVLTNKLSDSERKISPKKAEEESYGPDEWQAGTSASENSVPTPVEPTPAATEETPTTTESSSGEGWR